MIKTFRIIDSSLDLSKNYLSILSKYFAMKKDIKNDYDLIEIDGLEDLDLLYKVLGKSIIYNYLDNTLLIYDGYIE